MYSPKPSSPIISFVVKIEGDPTATPGSPNLSRGLPAGGIQRTFVHFICGYLLTDCEPSAGRTLVFVVGDWLESGFCIYK